MLKNALSHAALTLVLLAVIETPVQAQWTVSSVAASASGLDDGMVLGPDGTLFVSQYQGSMVRRIAPDGTVSIFATGFATPNGLAIDGAGNLYVANAFGGRISKVTPDGTVTHDFVSGIPNPSNLIFNSAGDTLYVAHYGTSQISKVALADPANLTSWVAGDPLSGPIGMAFDSDHNLYVGNFNDGRIFKISPGGTLTELASIRSSLGFLTLSNGYLYATSYSENRIYRLALDGSSMEVIAGTGIATHEDGPGGTASFNGPNGIVATASGDTLYVSDFNSGRLRMLVSTSATNLSSAQLPTPDLLDLQSFPNPSSATTTISYTLTKPGRVSLEIYDMLGRRLRTFAPRWRPTGTHTLDWDGRTDASQLVSPAAYTYLIRAEGTIQCRILVRQ